MSRSLKGNIQIVFVYFVLVPISQMCQGLHCYKCSGGNECGIYFAPNSNSTIRIQSQGDGFFDACAITRSPEGIISRDLVRSYECRSSENQYCCKSNWCNSLSSLPLPALTSLICVIGRCSSDSKNCDDSNHITYLSSPIESCFGTSKTSDDTAYRSYKQDCMPGQVAVLGDVFPWIGESFCCNSPECNREPLPPKLAIKCYVCDSRITGLAGCSTLNKSSSNVYEAGSSVLSEACAIIVGLPGVDTSTNNSYPLFIIRTFLAHCENQRLGTISYGGAIFQGRISCCWKNSCNTESLDTVLDNATLAPTMNSNKTNNYRYRIITIGIVLVISVVFILGIGLLIYKFKYLEYHLKYSNITDDSEDDITPQLNPPS